MKRSSERQVLLGVAVAALACLAPSAVTADQVIADDLIVQGSECVGNDCVNNEDFSFDTIRLKENNTRIKFDDTSSSAGFPANDWQLTANDSASGGANKFSIDDITGGRTPFTIEAASPNNSLYVDSTGRVGMRTNAPVLDLHIKTGNTPGLRLEQDGSSGFSAQTWDVTGNETNFFVRDVTGGSKLPLRIRPGAPSSSIDIAASGNVGIGTASPSFALHVLRDSLTNAAVVATRDSGAGTFMSATASYGQFGTITPHPTRFLVNSAWKMQINSDSSISMANGASLTAGGAWTNASSRALKTDVEQLALAEAMAALSGLSPVKFAYRANGERHVGFIAEDVPGLVATADRKGLSPMDIIAVLTRVVQEQEKVVQEQQKTIEAMSERISRLE